MELYESTVTQIVKISVMHPISEISPISHIDYHIELDNI